MRNQTKRRVFLPMMLMATLLFSAGAAEAGERRSNDRVKKGAVIGAAVGTLIQLSQGREGREVLEGALVGGVLGAAAGAASNHHGRNDRYDHYDRYDRYDQYDRGNHRYDGRYERGARYRHVHSDGCDHGQYDDRYVDDHYYDDGHDRRAPRRVYRRH